MIFEDQCGSNSNLYYHSKHEAFIMYDKPFEVFTANSKYTRLHFYYLNKQLQNVFIFSGKHSIYFCFFGMVTRKVSELLLLFNDNKVNMAWKPVKFQKDSVTIWTGLECGLNVKVNRMSLFFCYHFPIDLEPNKRKKFIKKHKSISTARILKMSMLDI